MSAGIGGINIDGAAGAAAGGGITAINISAGTTSNNLSALTFSNVAGGVSFGLNASTITASLPVRSVYRNFLNNFTVNIGMVNTHVYIEPFIVDIPIAFSYVWFPVMYSRGTAANTSSAYMDASVTFVFYTRNASTLTYITSFSNTMTSSWSSNNTPNGGLVPISASNAAATTLTAGEYFVAIHFSTTNTATNASTATTALVNTLIPVLAGSMQQSNQQGLIPWGSSAVVNSLGIIGGAGMLSTAATRSSIAFSDYTMSSTKANQALVALEFLNQTWQNLS